jgi:predicted permease
MLHAPLGVGGADTVVVATVQLPSGAYPGWPRVADAYSTLLTSIRQQPGIVAAGAAAMLPLDPGWRLPFQIEGRPAQASDYLVAQHIPVSSGYFEAVGASLAEGRTFTDADRGDTEPVVVVNESFARRLFPGEDALGRRIVSTARNIGPLGMNVKGAGPFRIVGVVKDVLQAPLGQAPEAVIYHALTQFPYRPMTLAARGTDAASATAALRSAMRTFDPTLPLGNPHTLAAQVREGSAAPRLLMFVLTGFAALTAVLAAIGVYGLLACLVNDRRRELAIRLALGAHPRSLAAAVTAQGIGLAAAGAGVGLVAAQLARRPLQAVLFETTTLDVPAAAATVALLLFAAALACFAPARRAARVAPVEGLRGE